MRQNGLLLLLLITAAHALPSCLTKVPLHADIFNNSKNCTWQCAAGYYKSASATAATCRPCSVASCPVGWSLKPCSRTADAACAPCPALPLQSGQVYTTNNSCNIPGCRSGFFLAYYDDNNNNNTAANSNNSTAATSTTKCRLCEPGHYCVLGTQMQCGSLGNNSCITKNSGATSLLECVTRSEEEEETVFSISFMLSLPQSRFIKAPNQTACADLDLKMMTWAVYGTFFGCAIAFATDTRGTLVCRASSASCIAGQYRQWLTQLMRANEPDIARLLRACLQRPDLGLGAFLVVQTAVTTILPTPSHNNNNTNNGGELLVYQQQKWGLRRVEVANVLAAFSVLVLFALLVLICCCGLLINSRRKRSSAALYHTLGRNHHAALNPHTTAARGARSNYGGARGT
jgi:hypothetical protein